MEEEDICKKFLNGLTNEMYEKIEMLDNSIINNIENNLRKYELSILIRSKGDKSNKDTERLKNEIDVLKNHI
jgi:polyhydroxyalkanoate synthesis regulator phasin